MVKDSQKTITKECRYSGITLHTGVRAHITFKPAAVDSGIKLIRVDLPQRPRIAALASNVTNVQRATTIANGDAQIHTVEHVLAALYACGIDNVEIEMDGPEPPIADGSSAPYIDLLLAAGPQSLAAAPRYFTVTEPFYIAQGESKLIALPASGFRITCTVKYGASLMDTQYLSLAIDQNSFVQELSRARTFCLYAEIEPLMKKGLIRGGSLDNAVVVKDGAIICKEGLRYPDEFVRHKMLDIVGDLSLTGRRINGEIIAIKPGHPTNVAMAQKIIAMQEIHDVEQR